MLPVVKHLVETAENQFRPCYKVKKVSLGNKAGNLVLTTGLKT